MLKVLVVDDNEAVRTALSLLFELHGLDVLTADSSRAALELVRDVDVGVVVQDMNFSQSTTSGDEGISLFREIHRLDPDLPVVLMTAWTSLETAVQLVKEGAADYIAKPWDDPKLLVTVQNLLRMRGLSQDNARLRGRTERERRELERSHDLCGLLYRSPAMHQIVSLAVQVARSDVPVLITGPNGSGKEKLAEIVHANSRRRGEPMVSLNAGALPNELLEAELFGAEPGAFTGATKLRIGRFEAAHRGTLFLDEIANLSPQGQMKLLRVLETGEFQRLGSSTTRGADVRVVSATNADLHAAIAAGAFREDLLFRLNVIHLEVPPLCERVEDVVPLAEHLLRAHAPAAAAGGPIALTAEAREALEQHDWPGNVRELQNRVQRALLLCRDGRVTPEDLGLRQGPRDRRPAVAVPAAAAQARPPSGCALDEAEKQVIEQTLLRTRGVVSRAAAELGLSRQALYRRMERLGIEMERRPRG